MVGFHLQRCWALSSFPFYSVSRDNTHSVVGATAGIGVDNHCEDRNAHWQSILGTFKMQPKRLIRIKNPPRQYLQSWSWGQTIIMQPQGWQSWPQLGTSTLEYWQTADRLQHHLNIILLKYLEYLWSKYTIVVGFLAKGQEENHLHRIVRDWIKHRTLVRP